MRNNEIGLPVSIRTPILVLSLTLSMILAKSENLEPKVSLVPYCVKKSALCGEWATTGLYFVPHNYCYSISGLVHLVETIRNRIKIIFLGDTIWWRLTFGINKKCEPPKSERKDVYIHHNVVQLQTQLLAPPQVIQKTINRQCPHFTREIVSSLHYSVNCGWNEPLRMAELNKSVTKR